MHECHVTAADADLLDLRRRYVFFNEDRSQPVERGVNAGDIRIHLEADLADLPILAKTFQEALHVRRAREGAQESAVARFDDVGNAGEAAFGQQRRQHAALCRAPGVQSLHHCAFLRRHETGAHRSRDTERVLHLHGIKSQQPARGRGGDERARCPLGMKPVEKKRGGGGVADAQPDFI